MKQKKRYVIRKYVSATSIGQALKLEKKAPVEECFVDENWVNEQGNEIGFNDGK